jgi:putative transposase
MPSQLKLCFDDVPLTCPVQQRYHAIAPCLAGVKSPAEQAAALNLSYRTILRWLRQFRKLGMPGLFPATEYPREPYTPERVIATLLHFKCCAPSASDRELARAVSSATGHHLHNETVKTLLERYFFWRHAEFRDLIQYPVPADPHERRMEMVRLHEQGWTDKTIAVLLRCNRNTVIKWVRRWKQQACQTTASNPQPWLLDLSHATEKRARKVYFGTIRAVLELQKRYGYAGWFRIQGYLERDYGIRLGETTIKKIMRLNRQLHLAPPRPIKVEKIRDPREGPPKSERPFQHTYVDIRYVDAKPEGKQLYSCLLLEGYSRTVLAGSLSLRQDVGIVLRIYYLALLGFGCWQEVISDHGGQFQSNAFAQVNRRLQIHHEKYEKGHPWQNLIESQFGIQARVGEYGWERCRNVDEAVELHRELIRDHNRLPHFAHRKRNDQKHTPLEVLGSAHGREIDAATLHRAFSRMSWKRKTDERGFVRINRWRIYVEEGLPKTPVQVTYWDGRLRAEYDSHILTEYRCRWDNSGQRPKTINQPQCHDHPYQSHQQRLFDPLWVRDPVEEKLEQLEEKKKVVGGGQQLRLYLGPALAKR